MSHGEVVSIAADHSDACQPVCRASASAGRWENVERGFIVSNAGKFFNFLNNLFLCAVRFS